MAKPGKKSHAELSAKLSLVSQLPDGLKRPKPPEQMTARQKEIWQTIVESEPVEWFQSAATQGMLHDLCCHRESVEQISAVLAEFKSEWIKAADGAKRYQELTRMRQNETKAAASIATKLRLTNQSRYTPQAAGTAARNMTRQPKPWEV